MAEALHAWPVMLDGTTAPEPIEMREIGRRALYGGGAEPKMLLEVEQDGAVRSYLAREIGDIDPPTWAAMKQAALPVVPELLCTAKWSLATDLKADGSEIYGKGYAIMQANQTHDRRHTAADEHFFEITAPSAIDNVHASVLDYATMAARAGLILPYEDPFELVVHPKGWWDIAILDLRTAHRMPWQDKEYLRDKNIRMAEWFIRQLCEIRRGGGPVPLP